jgi:BirA family biotin operon repressor/biotin-[acetyl-CoA-carboxylase] ligase
MDMDRFSTLLIRNLFGMPVYYLERVSSTMDEARVLARQGAGCGTVVVADFQEAGRGRIPGRPWLAEAGKNLFFTVLLRYADFSVVPKAITLKTGLAVSEAISDFMVPFLKEGALLQEKVVRVKWPNDVMIGAKKAAGILTEGDGKTVFIGIGVNVCQTHFPEELQQKATSIALTTSVPLGPDARFTLLEAILDRLFRELNAPNSTNQWQPRLANRLYRLGEQVRFLSGGADSGVVVEGQLIGIGQSGELLITPRGSTEPFSFITGELAVY